MALLQSAIFLSKVASKAVDLISMYTSNSNVIVNKSNDPIKIFNLAAEAVKSYLK